MRILNTAIQYDHRTFSWCQQRRERRSLVGSARQISRSADGYLYLLFALIAYIQGYSELLAMAGSAFVLERISYFVLKKNIRRNRPPDAIPGFQAIIQASDKFSFPSGHTSAAFLMATLMMFYFPTSAWFMYPWACCVGWSRVMLGVHFPSDTLAGAALGSGIAWAVHTNATFLKLSFLVQA